MLRAGVPLNGEFLPAPVLTTAEMARGRRRGPGRSILLALLVILSAGTAVVHYKFIPLDVLITWPKPTWLTVTSDPAGAEVKLDGRTLPDPTPTRIEVRRDLADHVLELTHPGSQAVRTVIRFDHSVVLSQTIALPAAPPPPPPPTPVPDAEKPPATAPVTKVAEVEPVRLAAKGEKRSARQPAKKKSTKQKGSKQKAKKAHKKKGGDSVEAAE